MSNKIQNLNVKTAKNIYNATVADFKELPAELRVSMTYDNGKEFSLHGKEEQMRTLMDCSENLSATAD